MEANTLNHNEDNQANPKVIFGFWVYIMTDAVMFAILFAVYAVLKTHTFGTIGIKQIVNLPHVLWQTIAFLLGSLFISSATAYMRMSKIALTSMFIILTIVCSIVFVVITYNDLLSLVNQGFTWKSSAFLSSYFTLIGFQLVHVLVALLWAVILVIQLVAKGNHPMMPTRVICLSMFWNYLNIIWIIIFTVVYLMGAM